MISPSQPAANRLDFANASCYCLRSVIVCQPALSPRVTLPVFMLLLYSTQDIQSALENQTSFKVGAWKNFTAGIESALKSALLSERYNLFHNEISGDFGGWAKKQPFKAPFL